MKFEIRSPHENEMKAIYTMGFDAWGDGASLADYLDECASSPKYKRGKWQLLLADDSPVASLITYTLKPNILGIGSIATRIDARKNGYAAQLIRHVLSTESTNGITHFLIYTEVGTGYYEKFGFKKLESEYQKSQAGTAMVHGEVEEFLKSFNSDIPKYF